MASRRCGASRADHVDVLNVCRVIGDMIRKAIGKNFATDASSRFLLDVTRNMAVGWASHAGSLNAVWLGCTNSVGSELAMIDVMTSTKHSCHSAVP